MRFPFTRAQIVRSTQFLCLTGWLCLLAIGQTLETSERSVRQHPDSESDRLSIATTYLQKGRNRNASQTLQEYLKTHKGSAAAFELLATAYLRQEDYPPAKIAASQALISAPNDATALYLLAMAEMGLQNPAEGERLLLASLKLAPGSAETNFQLGLLYTKRRKHLPEAIVLLEKARTKEPGSAAIETALGSAFLESGKLEDAVRCLESAAKLAPGSGEPWYLLADAFRRLHREPKADEALLHFNEVNLVVAGQRAREMRSRSLYEEGLQILTTSEDPVQLDKAAALFQQALHELPMFDAGYYRLAQLNYMKGDLPTALASIRMALKLNDLEPEYYYVQAKCLETVDRPSALESIRRAIALRAGVTDFEELLHELEFQK
jgi:tetratricopeptide (TPR) repeat protein